MKFKYIWTFPPIDFWYGTMTATVEETQRVLEQMPESSRDNRVYKIAMPCDIAMAEVFLCKADNNGTVYIFSDEDVVGFIDYFERV